MTMCIIYNKNNIYIKNTKIKTVGVKLYLLSLF